MGCDIHCYVEYRPLEPRNDYDKRWRDFGGRINPGRNYDLFDRMAGVRGDKRNAVVPPRGLPDDLAYSAFSDNWMWINYKWDNENAGECHEEGVVSPARAARYAQYRESNETAYLGTYTDGPNAGKPERVAHPDWHTHSWLTPDEFALAIEEARGDGAYPRDMAEYDALHAAMVSLVMSGHEVRLVFWFDN